jgi:hypothetical protein
MIHETVNSALLDEEICLRSRLLRLAHALDRVHALQPQEPVAVLRVCAATTNIISALLLLLLLLLVVVLALPPSLLVII